MQVPLVPGLRGSSAHRLLPMDLASCRDLPSGLPHSSILANVGARSTRTLDAVDVDTLADVAKLRRHPGYSLLRLVVVGDDVLEGRTSDENQLTTLYIQILGWDQNNFVRVAPRPKKYFEGYISAKLVITT